MVCVFMISSRKSRQHKPRPGLVRRFGACAALFAWLGYFAQLLRSLEFDEFNQHGTDAVGILAKVAAVHECADFVLVIHHPRRAVSTPV